MKITLLFTEIQHLFNEISQNHRIWENSRQRRKITRFAAFVCSWVTIVVLHTFETTVGLQSKPKYHLFKEVHAPTQLILHFPITTKITPTLIARPTLTTGPGPSDYLNFGHGRIHTKNCGGWILGVCIECRPIFQTFRFLTVINLFGGV